MKKIKKTVVWSLVVFVCGIAFSVSGNKHETQTVDAIWGGWNYNPGWSARSEKSIVSACQILKSEGLTSIAASGVIGNFQSESGMNPYIREGIGNHANYGPSAGNLDPDNDSFGPGRGLAQWGDGTGRNGLGSSRWLTLVSYVNDRYKKAYPARPSASWNNFGDSDQSTVRSQWPTLEEQLTFVKKELADGNQGLTLAGYNQSATPEDAAYLFAAKYERPGNLAVSIEGRKSEARRVYQNYCSKTGELPVKQTLNSLKVGQSVKLVSNAGIAMDNSKITEEDKKLVGIILKKGQMVHQGNGLTFLSYTVKWSNGKTNSYADFDIKANSEELFKFDIGQSVKLTSTAGLAVDNSKITEEDKKLVGIVTNKDFMSHQWHGLIMPSYTIQWSNGITKSYVATDVQANNTELFEFGIGENVKLVSTAGLAMDNSKITEADKKLIGVVLSKEFKVHQWHGLTMAAYTIQWSNGVIKSYVTGDVQRSEEGVYHLSVGQGVQLVSTAGLAIDNSKITEADKKLVGLVVSREFKVHQWHGLTMPTYTIKWSNGLVKSYVTTDVQANSQVVFKMNEGQSVALMPNAGLDINNGTITEADKQMVGVIVSKDYMKHQWHGLVMPAYTVRWSNGVVKSYVDFDLQPKD